VAAEKPGATTNSSTKSHALQLWYIIVGIREYISKIFDIPGSGLRCAVELATCVGGGCGGGSAGIVVEVRGWTHLVGQVL